MILIRLWDSPCLRFLFFYSFIIMKINEFGQFLKYASIQFEFFPAKRKRIRKHTIYACLGALLAYSSGWNNKKSTGSSFRLCIHLFTESNLLNWRRFNFVIRFSCFSFLFLELSFVAFHFFRSFCFLFVL